MAAELKPFGTYGQQFDPDTGTIQIPEHTVALLAPETNILEQLVNHLDRGFSTADLLKIGWPNSTVDEDSVYSTISNLHVKIGERCIKHSRKAGYQLERPIPREMASGRADPHSAGELLVYPSARRKAARGHSRSSFKRGENDVIAAVSEFIEWIGGFDDVVPYEADEDGNFRDWRRLAVQYSHRSTGVAKVETESWWCANLALDVDGYDSWQPMDISRYQSIEFTAHIARPANTRAMIQVSLLDDFGRSGAKHFHRVATSEAQPIGPYPRPIRIPIRGFDLRSHWANEGQECDLKSIVQIMFGQDEKIDDNGGVMILSEVKFIS